MKEIVMAVLASGAVFSFVQFMITFGFSRADKSKEIEKKIDALADRVDENQAILARTHILRFSDDLRNGVHHSEEYFRQQLLDIDTYNNYCSTHEGFSNGLTVLASEYIKRKYNEEFFNGDVEERK